MGSLFEIDLKPFFFKKKADTEHKNARSYTAIGLEGIPERARGLGIPHLWFCFRFLLFLKVSFLILPELSRGSKDRGYHD